MPAPTDKILTQAKALVHQVERQSVSSMSATDRQLMAEECHALVIALRREQIAMPAEAMPGVNVKKLSERIAVAAQLAELCERVYGWGISDSVGAALITGRVEGFVDRLRNVTPPKPVPLKSTSDSPFKN